MAAAVATVFKSKTGSTFLAFQWTGQAATQIPAWAGVGSAHASGGVLAITTRYGTLAVKSGDWVVQEPDGVPVVVANSVFQASYVAGP